MKEEQQVMDGWTDVPRIATFRAFEAKWCPECGKTVAMEPVRTGLPGIHAQRCPECLNRFQVNYLENEDDMLPCPDKAIFPECVCGYPLHRCQCGEYKIKD